MQENVILINGRITENVDVSVKTSCMWKNYIWNLSICSCKNGKCLAINMDDSAITSENVIESNDKKIKTIPLHFNGKKAICKTQNF